jgi:hypothetical protein
METASANQAVKIEKGRGASLTVHLAGTGLQRPIVATSSGILSGFAALIPARPAKPIGFRFEHGVQRLFDRPADHLAKMVPDPGFVDDHLTHRLLVTH